MAITEVYVDPSIAGDSGTGTIGDPYGDLQYALNTKVRDSTNGDRFNIKAGTAEVLAASLSLTTYGTPGQTSPLVFQGYTAAANDGGIGEISGNGSYKINGGAWDYVYWKNLKLGNCGNNDILTTGAAVVVADCEIHTATKTSSYAVQIGAGCNMINCYLHSIAAAYLLKIGANGKIMNSTFVSTASTSQWCVEVGSKCAIGFNIIKVNSSCGGLDCPGSLHAAIFSNNIFAQASTKSGIQINGTIYGHVMNNIIEGFSGTGGEGIRYTGTNTRLASGYNGFYNNTTNEDGSPEYDLGGNVSYGASPFVDAASGDFRLKPGIRGGGYPTTFKGLTPTNYLDLGAMQAIQSMRRSRAILIG